MANLIKIQVVLPEYKETFYVRLSTEKNYFDKLKKIVKQQYSILETTSFQWGWIDSENDAITIVNAEDFLFFVELKGNKLYAVVDSLWREWNGNQGVINRQKIQYGDIGNTAVPDTTSQINQSIETGKNIHGINVALNNGRDTEGNQLNIRKKRVKCEDNNNDTSGSAAEATSESNSKTRHTTKRKGNDVVEIKSRKPNGKCKETQIVDVRRGRSKSHQVESDRQPRDIGEETTTKKSVLFDSESECNEEPKQTKKRKGCGFGKIQRKQRKSIDAKSVPGPSRSVKIEVRSTYESINDFPEKTLDDTDSDSNDEAKQQSDTPQTKQRKRQHTINGITFKTEIVSVEPYNPDSAL